MQIRFATLCCACATLYSQPAMAQPQQAQANPADPDAAAPSQTTAHIRRPPPHGPGAPKYPLGTVALDGPAPHRPPISNIATRHW